MIVRKAFKFKLKTTPEIEQKCSMMAGCCRLVWNKALSMNLRRLENKEHISWFSELSFWLTFWKSTNELSFLKKVHSQPLQQTLKNLDRAFKDAFNKKQKNKRIPTFKNKAKHNSFRYPQGFKINDSKIFLPKIGWVSFFKSRNIEGTPKNVTVVREAKGWFVSIQIEQNIVEPKHSSNSLIGIDRGIAQLVVTSDGKFYKSAHSYRIYQSKLSEEQRKLKKKKRYSQNWKKQQKKISKVHNKIANIRKDRLHWISNRLSKNHAMIILEDLKVVNMSKSAKGSLEKPGRNVKAKSGLNRSILDQGWSMFASMLEYKQTWRGGKVMYVSPHYTSQICPNCQYQSHENRKTQRSFNCIKCGYKNNADHVGAINVLARGHRVLACGENTLVISEKQEPKVA